MKIKNVQNERKLSKVDNAYGISIQHTQSCFELIVQLTVLSEFFQQCDQTNMLVIGHLMRSSYQLAK
jgi:hypothetical protein